MGEFFDDVFLPTMKKLVEAGLSYDEVKKLLEDPDDLGGQDHRRAVRGAGCERRRECEEGFNTTSQGTTIPRPR